MASQVITLALDGAPTIEDYTTALVGLRNLLRGLTETVAAGSNISWVIDSLEAGSAISAFRGEAADDSTVAQVADAYLKLGDALARRDTAELQQWPQAVGKAGNEIIGIINGRVSSVRLETADDDVTITAGPVPVSVPAVPEIPSYGAVEGRIQTLSSRTGLRFTLYDLVHDRPVSCYLQPDQQDSLRELWDRLAVVEGRVRRDSRTGRPTAVRRIRRITPIDPVDENAWRNARGIVHSPEPAETIIRRLRDAQ